MKALIVNKFNYALADLIIGIKSEKTSPQALILSELISIAEGSEGLIPDAKSLYDHIHKTTGIQYANYRSIMHRLVKAGLIAKSGNDYFLCPEIANIKEAAVICELSYINKKK